MKHTLRISPVGNSPGEEDRAAAWQRTFDAALTARLPPLEAVVMAGQIANSLHGTFPETERFGVLNFNGEPS